MSNLVRLLPIVFIFSLLPSCQEQSPSQQPDDALPYPKEVAPVLDLWPNLCADPHFWETIGQRLDLMQALGYQRIYFVAVNPSYPNFSSPFLRMLPPDNVVGNHGLNSVLNIGDANFLTIYEAHKRGMEAVAVIKPYEGGAGATIPHNAQPFLPQNAMEDLGGIGVAYDNFLVRNPHLRVKRKPIPHYDSLMALPVTRIKLAFLLDEVRQNGWSKTGGIEEKIFPKKTVEEASASIPPFQLWKSTDNGTFTPLNMPFTQRDTVEERIIRDANGLPVYPQPKRVWVVSLEGLNIPAETAPYLAVSFENGDGQAVTLPFSMIQLY